MEPNITIATSQGGAPQNNREEDSIGKPATAEMKVISVAENHLNQEKSTSVKITLNKLLSLPIKSRANMPSERREQILRNLGDYGFTLSDFIKFEEFYTKNLPVLSMINKPFYIDRTKLTPPLSNSLLYVPSGSSTGMHILCKKHGGVKEIGLGGSSRVTLALYLDTGKKMAFRSALSDDIPESELNANKITAQFPEFFASGTPVHYKGAWNREYNPNEVHCPKGYREHDKTGFIMEYLEGGDFYDWCATSTQVTYKEKIRVARDIARALVILHELKLVHRDMKMENIFMTKDGKPKIGDFGFTLENGAPAKKGDGTTGMIPPDSFAPPFDTEDDLYCPADPRMDIWSLGCLFAHMIGSVWHKNNGQMDGDFDLMLNEKELEKIKWKNFPCKEIKNTMHYVIDRCLQLGERPTAANVADLLDEMYQKL